MLQQAAEGHLDGAGGALALRGAREALEQDVTPIRRISA